MYAMESPDIRFYDEGRAKLSNGIANISLDPIFIETVEPDYNVFLTPLSRTKGIYVAEQADEYFIAIKKLEYNKKLRNMMIAYEEKESKIEIITIHPITDEKIINRIMSRRWTK